MMVSEASGRPKLTAKGARTRARIVEAAAALIHERGVASTTLEDVKVAAEVSGSQLYHYFPDKNELVQAVIDYQAETIVSTIGRPSAVTMESKPGGRWWSPASKRTKGKGAAHSVRSAANWPRATPRPEPSSRSGSISGQPPSATDCDPFMPTGSSRPTSTRTISPLRLLATLQGGLLLAQVQRSTRPFETAVNTLLALTMGR